jgi:VIT1/CCC1 family predicted Fe2+/Mn2+ transporter
VLQRPAFLCSDVPAVKFSDNQRAAVILGAADGLTLAISEIMSLRQHEADIFRSGLGAGLGELVGMTAALWLSADDPQGFFSALACGVATLIACALPCAPYAFLHGQETGWAAGGLVALLGVIICRLRPQRGLRAVLETYGVLAGAGALCYASSLVRF